MYEYNQPADEGVEKGLLLAIALILGLDPDYSYDDLIAAAMAKAPRTSTPRLDIRECPHCGFDMDDLSGTHRGCCGDDY
jgi:hypothetical protein